MNTATTIDRNRIAHMEKVSGVRERISRIGYQLLGANTFPDSLWVGSAHATTLSRRLGVLALGLAYLEMDANTYRA